jgi:DNA-binding MarR family transcriptional regulator
MSTSDLHELSAHLIAVSARLIRLGARESTSSVPRALARALAVIVDLGEPRISDIAAADRISQPTATNLVQKLEERGWVERAPDPSDARAVRIQITAAGKAAQREFRRAIAEALTPRLAQLDDAQITALADGVRALQQLLEPEHPTPPDHPSNPSTPSKPAKENA